MLNPEGHNYVFIHFQQAVLVKIMVKSMLMVSVFLVSALSQRCEGKGSRSSKHARDTYEHGGKNVQDSAWERQLIYVSNGLTYIT